MGNIVATSDQVIENVKIVSTTGTCISISGVHNVTVRNTEIGPCGPNLGTTEDIGILISNGSSNTVVRSNVIHDVSSGIYALGAKGPMNIEKNYIYNIRGPSPNSKIIRIVNVRGEGSKVSCNVSDSQTGMRYGMQHGVNTQMDDHISVLGSSGTADKPFEISHNRLRGYGSLVGSGITLEGAWIRSHDNVVVNTGAIGIAIIGGENISHEKNIVYNDQPVSGSIGAYVWKRTTTGNCYNISMLHNKVWLSNSNPFWDGSNCSPLTLEGNNWNDTTLSPEVFNKLPAVCK